MISSIAQIANGRAIQSFLKNMRKMTRMYEVQHFTLCDGWINVWSDIDEEGNETPSVYATEQDAKKALDEYLFDTFMAYMEGDLSDFDHTQFRVSPINQVETG